MIKQKQYKTVYSGTREKFDPLKHKYTKINVNEPLLIDI